MYMYMPSYEQAILGAALLLAFGTLDQAIFTDPR